MPSASDAPGRRVLVDGMGVDAAVFGDFTVLMPLLYAHRVEAWKVHILLDARYFPVDPGAHWDVVPASVERLAELRKR